MPVFIFPPSGGGSPILSFLVGLATLAILIGLVIFFLPLIAGIVIAVILLIAAVYCWGWLKRKFGWESEEEKAFRQVMEKLKPWRVLSITGALPAPARFMSARRSAFPPLRVPAIAAE